MRDRPRLIWRAISQARAHHATHLAQAVAFNLFLVIPSVLLLALGVFTKVGSPGSVETLLTHLEGVVPNSVIDLVRQSLNQVLAANQGGTLIVVGALLALWALSGAMQTVMWSLNLAHGAEETRGFLHGRVVSVLMGLFALLAIAAMVVALVLGPTVSHWIDGNLGSQAGDIAGWAWSIGRWPAAALVLLVSFAVVLHLGPDVPGRRFRLITTGAVIAHGGVAGGLGRVRLLRQQLQQLQQELGIAGGGDHHADVAVAVGAGAAAGRRGGRRGRARLPR